ncbi:hypothetical protein ZOSMA_7G00750 [Zostera marina]|uniref:Uncharacterized protein n=1 Tax=Zostera marina TaxID=29655 RepID=A0A0K9NMR6_ZOSMR|nr:hypothetical protein ZOSMA_7G00750 [Zostera marina]
MPWVQSRDGGRPVHSVEYWIGRPSIVSGTAGFWNRNAIETRFPFRGVRGIVVPFRRRPSVDQSAMQSQRETHAKSKNFTILASDDLLAPTNDPLELARRDRVRRGAAENDDLDILQRQRNARSGFIIRAKMVDDRVIGATTDQTELERRRRFREGKATKEDRKLIDAQRREEESRRLKNKPTNWANSQFFASLLKPTPILPEGTTNALDFIKPVDRKGRFQSAMSGIVVLCPVPRGSVMKIGEGYRRGGDRNKIYILELKPGSLRFISKSLRSGVYIYNSRNHNL